jgi:hypothetical protein
MIKDSILMAIKKKEINCDLCLISTHDRSICPLLHYSREAALDATVAGEQVTS